jgi:Tol biopolymer transport system component
MKSNWLAILLLGSISACRPTIPLLSHSSQQPPPPKGYDPAPIDVISIEGENCCAEWDADGQNFYFLSRKRPRHEHYQVYTYDLQKKQAVRLSYHDGDDQGPIILGNTLFYASTTDSLKEQPVFLAKALGQTVANTPNVGPRPIWTMAPFDIYRANRQGLNIERLTNQIGFDGELTVHPKDERIIYTSVRQGQSQLIERTARGGERVFQHSNLNDGQARIAPNGKDVVWVRYNKDLSKSEIWLKMSHQSAKKIIGLNAIAWAPSWHPNGQEILFSSNHEDPQNFELYIAKMDGSCIRRLTYALGQDVQARFSPDSKRIIFSNDSSGAFQLYIQDYRPPTCP